MRCSLCGREAVVRVPYVGRWFCRDHFLELVESKVLRSIRRYRLIDSGDVVGVAVSGGKDSVSLAYILHRLSSVANFSLVLVHIDLGLGEYSVVSRRVVEDLSRRLGIDLVILSLRELLGIDIPSLSRRAGRPPCSVCGVVKRYLLNAVTVDLGLDSIATGHNLDDLATYLVKEFLRQNLEGIAKLYPRTEPLDGLAGKRIKPLVEVYEWELKIYSDLLGLRYVDRKCPLYDPYTLDNVLKKKLGELEERFPGILLGLVRNYVKRVDDYPRPSIAGVRGCSVCGLIASGDKCSFCKVTMKALGEPMGPKVRDYIRSIGRKYVHGQIL